MIYILTVLFVTGGVALIWHNARGTWQEFWGGFVFIWFFVSVVIIAPLATMAALVMTSGDTEVTTPIVSLADGQSVSGRFFLGSGVVDGHPAYTYYTGSEDTGFHLRSVSASLVTIRYTDESPRMVCEATDWRLSPSWVDFNTYDAPPDCDTEDGNQDRITFYVPAGSVQSNYTLDAQ